MNVLTAGTFDLPHYGHMNLIRWCKNLAGDGEVNMVFNRKEFVERFKKKKVVLNIHERMEFWRKHPAVDNVWINDGDGDFKKTINRIIESNVIDLIVIGSDWHSRDYLKQLGLDWDYLREKELGICYIPYTVQISTSEIKKRLNEN